MTACLDSSSLLWPLLSTGSDWHRTNATPDVTKQAKNEGSRFRLKYNNNVSCFFQNIKTIQELKKVKMWKER